MAAIARSPPFSLMSRLSGALAVLLAVAVAVSAQPVAAHVTGNRDVLDALPFELPTQQHLKGKIRSSPGHRLHVVSLVLGDEPVFADVRKFTLITSRGVAAAVGAGGTGDSMIPFESIPVGQEIGQVLPTDAMLALTRTSPTTVMLELGPHGTIAFLFEVLVDAEVRALRLPDGRELPLKR